MKTKRICLLMAAVLALTAAGCTAAADDETKGVTIVNEKNTLEDSGDSTLSAGNTVKLSYTYEDKGGTICVYEDGALHQELVVPDWQVSEALGKNYTYLTMEDVNFDGYEDLVYLYELGDINAYYYAFLYHSESSTFEACEEYAELANPELTPEEKMILATDRTGDYTYVITTYSWDGYNLVQVESMEVGVGDDNGIYTQPEYTGEVRVDNISGEYVLGDITVGIIIYSSPRNGADGEFMAMGSNSKGEFVDAWGDLKAMGDNVYFSGIDGNGIVFTFTEDCVQIIDSRNMEGSSNADLNGMYWK